MKSVYETDIDVPQAKLANFYANPENNIKWMADLKKCEFISGEPGMPGSKYRLVPKKAGMLFIATIISKNLPYEAVLALEAPNVNVLVTGKFIAISAEKTKFISEEIFTFKGLFNKVFGFFAGGAIEKAHYKHMNDFKQVVKTI